MSTLASVQSSRVGLPVESKALGHKMNISIPLQASEENEIAADLSPAFTLQAYEAAAAATPIQKFTAFGQRESMVAAGPLRPSHDGIRSITGPSMMNLSATRRRTPGGGVAMAPLLCLAAIASASIGFSTATLRQISGSMCSIAIESPQTLQDPSAVATSRGGAYRRPQFGADVTIAAGNGTTVMQMQPALWLHRGRTALIYSCSTSPEFAESELQIRLQNADLTWTAPITPFPAPDPIDGMPTNFIMAFGTEIGGVTYFVAQAGRDPETPAEKFDCYVFRANATLTVLTRLAKLRLAGNDWTIPSSAIVVAYDDSWVFAVYVKGAGSYSSAVHACRSTDQGVTWEMHALTVPPAPYFSPSETQLFVSGRTLEAWTRHDDRSDPANEVILKCASTDAGLTWGAITVAPRSPDPEVMNGPWGARDGPSLMYVGRNSASLERFRIIDPLHSSLWLLPGKESYSIGAGFLRKGPGLYQFVRSRNGTLIENSVTLIPDVLLDLTVGEAVESGRGLAVTYNGGVAGVHGWEQTSCADHAVVGSSVGDFTRLHDGSVPIMLGISGKFASLTDGVFLLSTNAGSSNFNGLSISLNNSDLRIFLSAGGGESDFLEVPAAVGEFGYIIHIGRTELTVWDSSGRRLGAKDISGLARNYGFNAVQAMCLGKSGIGATQAASGLILRRMAIWTTEPTGAAVTAMANAIF
jgi:hypothetical protein